MAHGAPSSGMLGLPAYSKQTNLPIVLHQCKFSNVGLCQLGNVELTRPDNMNETEAVSLEQVQVS